ncbi:hypothetical protein NIES2135_15410 [Leptolyngbya boryana NIES-2135]|uniref:Uncharacterized protein n=1 Tax=Leptolyngbya boryana NIES-2135 TaxID=1973484 RepID=A0A1Z4JDH9_LEPBY|nr:hypothetical protein NIES2135_15410 [Leptolyngbya boryana NIES-2135]
MLGKLRHIQMNRVSCPSLWFYLLLKQSGFIQGQLTIEAD